MTRFDERQMGEGPLAGASSHDPHQLIFDFELRPAFGKADFVVAPCNAQAVEIIDSWPNWPGQILALFGEAGSGKSHLAKVWQQAANATLVQACALTAQAVPDIAARGAVIVEDGQDLRDEKALFHLFNYLKQENGFLLLTGREAPSRWAVGLADLKSRLSAVHALRLDMPDDAILKAVLEKQFKDRQVEVSEDLADFVLWRIERSFESVGRLVEALDRASLSQKRKINKQLARDVIKAL